MGDRIRVERPTLPNRPAAPVPRASRPGPTAALLDLQRSFGNRAVRALVEPRPRPAAAAVAVQRRKLEPSAVIDAVADIKFGGTDVPPVSLAGGGKTPQGLDLIEAARRRMEDQQEHWSGAAIDDDALYNALLLVHAVDVVADVLARSDVVFLPTLKPQISRLLLEHFREDITKGLTGDDSTEKKEDEDKEGASTEPAAIVRLAQALTGGDPLTLYLKDIVPAAATAASIRRMADEAKRSPLVVFQALKTKLMAELRPLTAKEVATGQAVDDETGSGKGNDFPLKELVGEISTSYHEYVLGKSPAYAITSEHKITESAADRLGAVEKLLAPEEKGEKATSLEIAENRDPIVDELAGWLKISPEAARTIKRQALDHLSKVPVMMTLPHGQWFDEKGAKRDDTKYQSIIGLRHQKEKLSSVIRPGAEGELSTLGRRGEGPLQDVLKPRGERYLRWRVDKDRRAEHEEMPFEVFPVYGCLCYWRLDQWGAGGSNYYGDIHFLLKPEKRQAARYKYTDQGEKFADVEDLLRAILARNKAQFVAIIGEVLDARSFPKPTNNIEVILPGGVDIKSDVQQLIVSSSVPGAIAEAIAKWGDEAKVPVRDEKGAKALNRSSEQMGMDEFGAMIGEHDVQIRQSFMEDASEYNAGLAVAFLSGVVGDPGWSSQQRKFFSSPTVPDGVVLLRQALKAKGTRKEQVLALIKLAGEHLKTKASPVTTLLYQLLTDQLPGILKTPSPNWTPLTSALETITSTLKKESKAK